MVKKIFFGSLMLTTLLNAQRTEDVNIPIRGATSNLSWSPKEPKEGEVVTVTLEFTSPVDASQLHVSFVPHYNTKTVGPTAYDGSIKKGETKRFVTKIILYRSGGGLAHIGARVYDPQGIKLPSGGTLEWGDLVFRWLYLVFDESTKTFVGRGEYARRRPEPPLPPEYTYDIILGQFTPSCLRRHDDAAREIRNQMEELKSLDSALTDLEALEMLHDMEYEMVVRYGIKGKEAIPILIEARQLSKAQGISKWEAVDEVIKEIREKGRINFFRGDFISCNYTWNTNDNYPYHYQQENIVMGVKDG